MRWSCGFSMMPTDQNITAAASVTVAGASHRTPGSRVRAAALTCPAAVSARHVTKSTE